MKPANCSEADLQRFISSLERGEEFSPTCFSTTVPFVPSKSNHTVGKSSTSGSKTESCRGSLYSKTQGSSTANRGKGFVPASVLASHVRTFLRRGKGWVSGPASVQDYGRKLQESLEKSNLYLLSSRIRRSLSLADWILSSLTLPTWGILHDGECWELGTSVEITNGKESGYWPTPTKSDGHLDGMMPNPLKGESVYLDKTNKWRKKLKDGRSASLGLARLIRYPTPGKLNGLRGGGGSEHHPLKWMYPGHPEHGFLNPDWMEALMGWIPGWTSLKHLVGHGETEHGRKESPERKTKASGRKRELKR